MANVKITLPDGSTRDYPPGVTIKEVAQSIGSRLGKDAIGGVLGRDKDAHVIDVHTPIKEDAELRIVTLKSPEGLDVLRHSCSHLMASAVQRLFPGTQVTFGPAVENGFYYDFYRPEGPFTPDELEAIEAEMRRIAAANDDFVREEISREEARALFEKMGERFKREHVDRIPKGEQLTLYKHGDWVDLCEGPHVPNTKYLKHFKLTHVSGAYWLGDERNPQLSRIYGTCFWDKESLEQHLHNLEEAKKRDHRKLGKELELFLFDSVAPAMPFFLPKGAGIYNRLVEYVRRYYDVMGFSEVVTPQVVDTDLFKRSGHYDNYKDNMFFSQIDDREYGVKPMNCPGHALMFGAQKWSYRDLPVRYADFGRLHRYERSGVTAGLTRVRSFAQDDAHIFCREDQLFDEISKQIVMVREVFDRLELELRISFSTRPEQSIGREPGLSEEERAEWDRIWAKAESVVKDVFEREQIAYVLNEGDGAFYAPKIDFEVCDALGRWHQLSTVQVDFAMPRRFGLKYDNEEGGQSIPVMVHRAVLGSIERFMGILIEHTGGDFPVWLAPVQLRVLTIHPDLVEYGRSVARAFKGAGVRVALDDRNEKLGYKIRDAEVHKVPFVAVIGKKEQEQGGVALRRRKGEDLGTLPLDRAVSLVVDAAAIPSPSPELVSRVEEDFRL